MSNTNPPQQSSATSNTPTILVVEDNTIAMYAIQITLKRFQCTIDVANNGEEAIHKAKTQQYDFILMDMGLPDMNGLTVAEQIRALPDAQLADVPIVALTADAQSIRKQCLSVGIQAVLNKPASIAMLKKIFKRFLSNKPHTINPLPSIDLEEGAQALGGDHATAKRLLTLYRAKLGNIENEFVSAFANNDKRQQNALLHGHIGNLQILGLPKLRAIMTELQKAVKNNQTDKIQYFYTLMIEEIQSLKCE